MADIAAGRLTRLVVEMPPRHGKSELLGKYFPAWYLGTFPERRVIYVSYGAKHARQFGLAARNIFAEWGRRVFGAAISPDSSAADAWNIRDHGGGMVTTGVGGPLTGKGADVLIIDDPIKNAAEAVSQTHRDAIWNWFHSTGLTRLEPGGAVIVNMTRWHRDDLVGRLRQQNKQGPWRALSFPAICEIPDELGRRRGDALWPQRYPLRDQMIGPGLTLQGLESIRAEKPLAWWLALYQQQPGHHEHLMWPASYFEPEQLWFDPWPDDLALRVLALDPSKGTGARPGDYSAYVMLGVQVGGTVWVDADLSNRRPVTQLVEDGVRHYRRFRPDAFCIEGNAWQDLLAPLFRDAFAKAGIWGVEPTATYNHINKQVRIERLDVLLRARQMRFRKTEGARLLVQQLRDFPVGRHDDGPDALEMAVRTAIGLWSDPSRESTSQFQPAGNQPW